MFLVYLASMKQLTETDPEIWKFIQDWNFIMQQNQATFKALGYDYVGEHEIKIPKIEGRITGIIK